MRTDEERNQLVEQNLEFARRVSLRLARRLPQCFTADDLFQQACLGLMEAATRWSPDTGMPFQAYARRRVMGAMLDSIRRRHWRAVTSVGLEEAAEIPSDQDLESQVARKERAQGVRVAVLNLPEREMHVVGMFYGRASMDVEIGPQLGVGANRVGQIRREALRLLRPALAGLQRAA